MKKEEAVAAKPEEGAAARTMPPPPSYRRPTSQRAPRRAAPPGGEERFQAEALGGALWRPDCAAAARAALPATVPLAFPSVEDYVATFDPLVLEEAREGLRAEFAEAAAAGRSWAVEIASVDGAERGWAHVRLRGRGAGFAALREKCSPNSVVVLTLGRPPTSGRFDPCNGGEGAAAGAEEEAGAPARPPAKRRRGSDGDGADAADSSDADAEPRLAHDAFLAGLVVFNRDRGGTEIVLRVHPACARHAGARAPPCGAALAAARAAPRGAWRATPAGVLVSQAREFAALHAARGLDSRLLRAALSPATLAEAGRAFADPEVRRRMWPAQAQKPAFVARLRAEYDYRQLEAIEMAACHLGGEPGAPAAEGLPPALPFVLVQGPPGTGKTHTVRGILNVWHLVAFQRHYDAVVAAALPRPRAGAPLNPARARGAAAGPAALLGGGVADGSVLDALAASVAAGAGEGGASRVGAAAARRPRILVCAPSNAACDELCARVLTARFVDGEGREYLPDVVRVGAAAAAVAPEVRPRLLSALVARYRDMPQPEWQSRSAAAAARGAALGREVAALEASLARAVERGQAAALAGALAERADAAAKVRAEAARLEAAQPLVWARARDAGAARRAEAELEALLLADAEMVFTTLGSSQRREFRAAAARRPFHTVLIDEAGQASEVAALQPLALGARRAVLVGDPQQLPATVLSDAARAAAMERSLFERLQAGGCPSLMLSVQYRMHPEIRSFPSRHFYGGRLEDAAAVTAAPDEPWHAHPLLRPYLFFDVARGRERRREPQRGGDGGDGGDGGGGGGGGSGSGGGFGSLSNPAEAELAVALYAALRSALGAAPPPPRGAPPVSVAVITPYREQRRALRAAFERFYGPASLAGLAVETVDSYQGRQVDVVILSCVRASAGGGLGFVNDVRRLNVAITRARRSLWVLGAAATLRANAEWRALVEDAGARGAVVRDADARALFPGALEALGRAREAARAAEGAAAAAAREAALLERARAAAPAAPAAQGQQQQAAAGAAPYYPPLPTRR